MVKTKLSECLNCHTALSKADNFCPNCGQKNHATQLTIRLLLNDLFTSVFNLDARLWITLKTALFKIGTLVKEFNQGKRKKYLPPFQFYLFCSVLYFILQGFSAQQKEVTAAEMIETITQKDSIPMSMGLQSFFLTKTEFQAFPAYTNQQIDSLLIQKELPPTFLNRLMLKQSVKILSNGTGDMTRQLNSFMSTGMFLLLPFFAWLLYLFFARIYPFYVEHLVFSVYLHAIAFLILTIDLCFEMMLGASLIKLFFYIVLLIYVANAIKQFYNLNWGKTILYLFLLNFLYGFVLIVFIFFIAIISLILS